VTLRYLVASAVITGIVVVTVWLTDLSFQRAILLAPVLVIGVAAAAGMAVFWGRVGWESLRKSRHPRLIVAASMSLVAVVVVLTLLGVQLPHE
jgi:formate hydrogenlyase subunit 3/multisubunit Na+/H+ antiporter MnhD subunit